MSAAIKAEFRKLFSTRMWWILIIVMVAYLGFMSILLGFALSSAPAEFGGGAEDSGVQIASLVYSVTNPFGYVFPLLIGSLMFTGEFRHKTITATLLVGPNRNVLLLAKILVAIVLGAIYGLVATATTVAGAAPFLSFVGDGAHLGEPEIWKLLAASVLTFMLWAMLGAAVGGLITNQVAAIIVILAFTQFVEPILRVALVAWESARGVSKFLPSAAGDAIIGSSFMTGDMVELLARYQGVLMLLAYVAVFAALARVITLRRDIG